MKENRQTLNRNLAQMLKGGVIMDVTTPEQARIAEAAGACAVMALERIPADIRAAGGVSRMSDPKMIRGIQEAVTIPVMAKCRIGHFAEAQILQAIEIDYIDESEVLSPADDVYHIDKTQFEVPFVCGAKDLGEALRRIAEGATMIRTKGEPGTGDIIQAVRHMRMMQSEIRRLVSMSEDELYEAAKQLRAPYDLVKFVHENGKLPVVNFAAGGVATPADAALMMQLGAEGVFVGSGIFKSGNPAKRAQAIVKAVTNYRDAKLLAELSEDLGEAMRNVSNQLLEGNRTDMFVTAWVCVLQLSTGEGIALNAGHEHPARRSPGGKYALVTYKHSIALATFEDAPYREHSFKLDPGDSIFVYTDGVPEANNSANEFFGTERMLEALNKNPDASPQEIIKNVTEGIEAFTQGADQFDDITMLSFKYLGPKK